MPRPRARPLFEIAGQWIATDPNSPMLYRFWTEPGTGRTRRASLRTTDIELAKRLFAEAVLLKGPKTPDSPLAAVLEAYFLERTDRLPSKKHARLAGKLLLACWGSRIRVSQLTEAKQREFAEWSVKRGHSLSYISRNLSVLAAAAKHGKLPMEILFGKAQIKDRWALQTKAPRRIYIPTDDDLARFLSSDLPEPFFRWCVIACLTGARPEAVLDLTPAARNKDARLLNLNPQGRAQNKKHRPIVREPVALRGWLGRWEKEMREAKAARELARESVQNIHFVLSDRYCTYSSVESVQTAIERARAATGIPLSAYSFRHKVATVLRRARITEDQIAWQLGHRRPDMAITAGYGEWSPDYLAPVAKALDAWWAGLARKANRPLNSRATLKRPQRPKLKLVASR